MKTSVLAIVAASCLAAGARADEPEDWNLKAQATYVWQLKPPLTSPYSGPHSLSGEREKSYSLTATVAVGWRVAPHTEVYLDPEVAQGVPLSGLLGLAGFTNGELARTSGPELTLYRARLFVRHVIGLSDEQEEVEASLNQLGSRYAKQRLVLTAGNLSVLDVFDANAYSHDPRTQFMNWTLMTHGAYDYAADARGYSWGLAVEYIADGWALRGGRFAQPREPNQLPLDPRIGAHFGDQLELERPFRLGEQAGVARLLMFRNRAVMSRYDDALALAAATATLPDLDAVRTTEHTKVGVGVNVEQRVSGSAGVFARAMWADGKTETYAFTEADRSASAGVSVTGAGWGRAADTVGFALAQNMLSSGHRQMLALGGQTFFLGDGRLNYRPERIVEAYYAISPMRQLSLSLDLQRIANPGYNADRGPASFIGARVHVEL